MKAHTSIFLAYGLAFFAAASSAQPTYPTTKPITIIVPSAAGSGTDIIARALAVRMAPLLGGATFVIDNKPGGNTIIAATAAAKAAPDGYTLFIATNTTHSVNPVIYKTLPYDPVKDFVPVGLIGETAPALLTAATNPISTVKGLVEEGKKKPQGLNFAVANTSGLAATQVFRNMTGVNTFIVNYKATPPALVDTAAGVVDYHFGDLASGGALVKGGKLKALAVLGNKRQPGFDSVPTMAEAGFPGIEVQIWIGLFAPKGTPTSIVERLNAALVAAQKQPALTKLLADATISVHPTSTEVFTAYVAAQSWRWAKLAREINLQAE